jgi:hypothetical protein
MPSREAKSLLCLYNYDVDLKLLRIDPNSPPRHFPAKSVLPVIVLAATWLVTEGTDDDWREFIAWYKGLPPASRKRQSVPDLDLGVIRFCSYYSEKLQDQIRINYLNRGNDGRE